MSDIRCECGNMIARLTDDGVELFCRRCKRLHIIELSEDVRGKLTQNTGGVECRKQE